MRLVHLLLLVGLHCAIAKVLKGLVFFVLLLLNCVDSESAIELLRSVLEPVFLFVPGSWNFTFEQFFILTCPALRNHLRSHELHSDCFGDDKHLQLWGKMFVSRALQI